MWDCLVILILMRQPPKVGIIGIIGIFDNGIYDDLWWFSNHEAYNDAGAEGYVPCQCARTLVPFI